LVRDSQRDELLERMKSQWARYSDSAKAQTEFVVVDDGSQKDVLNARSVKQQCADAGLHCTLVTIEKDIGFNHAGVCNTGAAVATGRFVVFLDMDHYLLPEGLEALLAELKGHGDAPLMSVEYLPTRHTNLTTLPPSQWRTYVDKWYKTYLQGMASGRAVRGAWRRRLRCRDEYVCDAGSPNTLYVERLVFQLMGGYNEEYSGHYGYEDIAFT
jgi:predicted glycosyltransferase involved in capsule biosynthesis